MKAQLIHEISALRRYALVLCGNRADAEDLVQECLARAIAAAPTWPGGPHLRRWLFRILHNLHVSDLRRRRVRIAYDQTHPAQEASAPTQLLEAEARAVLTALSRLPEAQREALTLVAIEGMRYEEAAAILAIPVGTLMSRLARGRESLRQAMADDERPALRLVKGQSS